MKRSAIAVLALLAVSVGSCSTGQSGMAEPTVSSSTGQPSAPKPVARLGDTLHLDRVGEEKIAVTLVQVINPATVSDGGGDPEKAYLATKLTIVNTGTSTIVGNVNTNVAVIGSDDQSYTADFAVVAECKNFVFGWFLLAANSSITGCVTFALPPAETPVKVRYAPSSGLSDDIGEWLIS